MMTDPRSRPARGRPQAPGHPGGDRFAERCARLGPALMGALALTDIQAAGLLGNLGHETGGFRHLQEIAPAIPGTAGGWGLAQWTGRRRLAMEAWCRARGLDPASDDANEGYLMFELATSEAAALAALRRTTSLDQATEVFCRLFERPGIVALPDRVTWARRALAAVRGAGGPTLKDPPINPPRPATPAGPARTRPAARPRRRPAQSRPTPARRHR